RPIARRHGALGMPLRTVLFLAAVLAAGLLAYDLVVGAFCDGKFPLEVKLVSKTGREIVGVSAQALMQREWGEELRSDPQGFELDLQPVKWVEGRPFTVRVPFSSTRSGFGRELSYGQFELLVLRVEYADGTIAIVTARIPDGHSQRELSVEAP